MEGGTVIALGGGAAGRTKQEKVGCGVEGERCSPLGDDGGGGRRLVI